MNEENQSIHAFDINLICEYFSTIERQGPGGTEATLKALSYIGALDPDSVIVDLGSGTGSQTFVLASQLTGKITALDLFPDFIGILNRKAEQYRLDHRVKGVIGSMDQLPFDHDSIDLIWSEGAIYNIGYSRGLKLWHPYLKAGGYVAVTEATWFTDSRPEEVEKFWHDAYPEIDTIANKLKQMQESGYQSVAHFVLPQQCWTDNYYLPQRDAQKVFLEKYPDNPTALALVSNQQREAELYDRYSAYYGYVFYIGKKI
jgi:ubiquinone/menaquinone biosynthesis C-methylase UbiE